uniref:Uncharacterized protein n=1 Tax=Arundo donax TaxID=35708 RepID=A0A0A9HEG7_ARUDO
MLNNFKLEPILRFDYVVTQFSVTNL